MLTKISRYANKKVNKYSNRFHQRWDHWHKDRSCQNSKRFGRLYRKLTDQRFARDSRSPEMAAPEVETRICGAVDQLRNRGIAVLPGWLDEESLSAARNDMARVEARWHEFFSDGDGVKVFEDEATLATFQQGNHAKYGRLRAVFHARHKANALPFIKQLHDNSELKEIASRYFDANTESTYVLAERLDPSPEPDEWHFDRITDQLKVMILLTDVEMSQGPLRYKTNTHRNPPGLEELYFRVFQHGVDEGYPSEDLVASLPGEILYGTGKAGDCFIFDTVGVHSGTQCLDAFRQAYVVTFYGPTDKTDVLNRYSPQSWL